jgi:hypothetical protein
MLTKNNNGYHGSRRYSAGTESSTGFTPAAQSLGASNGGCLPPQRPHTQELILGS